MRVCGYCGWRALCRQLCAVLCFFARFSDWRRSASLSSLRCLRGGGHCGRSFRNRRNILRQLRANLIRPDNLPIHHELLNQPPLRRDGLLEVLLRTFRQREPLVFLGTREPADPVDRPIFRGNERACSLRSFALESERACSLRSFALESERGRSLRSFALGSERGRSLARGSERGRRFHRLVRIVVGLCVGKEVRGIVVLGKGLLGNELVGERARFWGETLAPARDQAEGVVASLHRARLRYVEALVMLKSGFKAAAVIKRARRFGRGGLGCAV